MDTATVTAAAVAAEPDSTVETPETPRTSEAAPLVTEDLLVEDVSIDGMCGVY